MSLRELIETASADLDRYKSPDVSEVRIQLEAILTAGKIGSIQHDKLESLRFCNKKLEINTVYSVRGCVNSAEYIIPESVIDADDPIAAIKTWAKEKRIKRAQDELQMAKQSVVWAEAQLLKAQQED